MMCYVGGLCADVGSPTCTHLVVEERIVKSLSASIQGRPVVVRSEVALFITLLYFMHFCHDFSLFDLWLTISCPISFPVY